MKTLWHDYTGKSVLVTGGTRGIGLATALAFGRRGAHVTITHKWDSADLDAVRRAFADIDAPAPQIVQADVAKPEEVRMVLEAIEHSYERLDVFVSNVAVMAPVRSVDDYIHRNLHATIDYNAWPLVSHTLLARELFGRAPRYVIAMSSCGSEAMHVDYDFAAASKALLESLGRYLHYRLRDTGTTVNIVRSRFVATDLLDTAFGTEFAPFVRRYAPDVLSEPAEIAEAIFGLCSGLMDGVGGQVITVDRGAGLYENFGRLYGERERHPLDRPGDEPASAATGTGAGADAPGVRP